MSAATSLAVRPANEMRVAGEWSSDEIETLRDTVASDLTQAEFKLFGYVCQRTGLDPFRKQIYAIKRKDRDNPNGKLTFQTGIDGYRAIAFRTDRCEGQTAPQWCGPDGVWREVWLEKQQPAAARIGVFRAGCREPFWGVARFSAYAQTKYDGGTTMMWTKMGAEQLAKCAEALALRKAFPEEYAGVYTKDEMAQAENEAPAPQQRQPAEDSAAPTDRQAEAAKDAMAQIEKVETYPALVALMAKIERSKALGSLKSTTLSVARAKADKLQPKAEPAEGEFEEQRQPGDDVEEDADAPIDGQ